MDMLGRYLRSQGHRVDVVSAVDGFDSYVLWKALQEQRTPEAVVRDYHGQIAHDLRALDVEVDDFLDLVQGPYAQQHARNAQRTVERLVALGVTQSVVERVLYCPDTRRYMAGRPWRPMPAEPNGGSQTKGGLGSGAAGDNLDRLQSAGWPGNA